MVFCQWLEKAKLKPLCCRHLPWIVQPLTPNMEFLLLDNVHLAVLCLRKIRNHRYDTKLFHSTSENSGFFHPFFCNQVKEKWWNHLGICTSKRNTFTSVIMQRENLQTLTSCCTWMTDRKHDPNRRGVSWNNGKDYKTPSLRHFNVGFGKRLLFPVTCVENLEQVQTKRKGCKSETNR